MKTLNGKDAIQFGFKALRANFLFFFGIVIIIFVANYVIPQFLFGQTSSDIGLLARLVTWVISAYAGLGLAAISLRAVDNKSLSYQDFFRVTHVLVPYLIATILFQVALAVGTMLLIIPGIIVALMWMFYAYFILDKGLQPIDALKKSAEITKGNRWQLLGVFVVLIVMNIAGALLFGLGLIVTVPVTAITIAHMYRQLS